jgi:nitrate/TMAO reductase-like tetraheme cytochrome c subunit
MKKTVLPGLILAGGLLPAPAHAAEGLSFPELMQWLGIFAAVTAIVLLVCVEFLFRDRLGRVNYYWLLLFGLFVLPFIALGGTISTVFEETKTVDSCASCHVMEPFVDDMKDSSSPTLAARHFKNRWIKSKQCYHCHSGYGVHGTLAAKRDGFRHWAMYVTRTYPDPLRFRGSYPNSNCLTCHANTPKFAAVKSHRALRSDLEADEVACITCHGPPHPTPKERLPHE